MNIAKFYIYRNLRTKGFSVRYRGKVIDRLYTFSAEDVTFKVNELGRQRVIKEKQKNVHAFIVCSEYKKTKNNYIGAGIISYNPYKNSYFEYNNKQIFSANAVFFKDGKCFLVDK